MIYRQLLGQLFFVLFICCFFNLGWPPTSRLQQSSCLSLLSSCDHRHSPPHPTGQCFKPVKSYSHLCSGVDRGPKKSKELKILLVNKGTFRDIVESNCRPLSKVT